MRLRIASIIIAASTVWPTASTLHSQAVSASAFRDPQQLLFPPDQTAADYGRGYDALLGEVLSNRCLAYNGDSDLSPETVQPTGDLYLRDITDRSAFLSEFHLSAAMSLGLGPFAGSATYQQFESMRSASYSRALILRAYSEQHRRLLKAMTWTRQAIKAMNTSATELRRICGTHLIVGIIDGGDMAVTYQLTQTTQSTASSSSMSASASYAGFASGQVSLQSIMAREAEHSSIEAKVARKGTNDGYPDLTKPDELEAAVRNFQRRLAETKQTYPLFVLAVPIGRIASPLHGCDKKCKGILHAGLVQGEHIANLATLNIRLRAIQDTLAEMRDRPSVFIAAPASPVLKTMYDDVTKGINSVADAATRCASLTTTERECTAAATPLLQGRLPVVNARRIPWMPLNPKTTEPQRIGETPSDGQSCVVDFAGKYSLGSAWPLVPFQSGYTAIAGNLVPSRLELRNSAQRIEVAVPYGTTEVTVPAGYTAFATLGDAWGWAGDNITPADDPIRAATYCK